jgi:hypothetical protein
MESIQYGCVSSHASILLTAPDENAGVAVECAADLQEIRAQW